jgi:hypothetical protein
LGHIKGTKAVDKKHKAVVVGMQPFGELNTFIIQIPTNFKIFVMNTERERERSNSCGNCHLFYSRPKVVHPTRLERSFQF